MSEKLKITGHEAHRTHRPEVETAELEAINTHETAHAAQTEVLPPNNEGHLEQTVAVGGVRGVINNVRLWRARRTVAKMDHKDAFYDDIADTMLGTGDYVVKKGDKKKEVTQRMYNGHEGKPVQSRSLAERFMDARLDRKRDRMLRRETTDRIYQKIHGQDGPLAPKAHVNNDGTPKERNAFQKRWDGRGDPSTMPSIRQGVVTNLIGLLPGATKPQYGIGAVIAGNVERFFRGPDIPGSTPIYRWLMRNVEHFEFWAGKQTAEERRHDIVDLNAEPVKHGNRAVKISRRQNRRTQERVRNAAEQPLLSLWRNFRRNRAQERINRIESAEKSAHKRSRSSNNKHPRRHRQTHPKIRNQRHRQHA